MVETAKPELVRDVAGHWQDIHDDLVGRDGTSGIKKRFDDAVAKVLENWHGESADRFWEQAQKISLNFKKGAPYAQEVAKAMGEAADSLRDAKDAMRMIDWAEPEEPYLSFERAIQYGTEVAPFFLMFDGHHYLQRLSDAHQMVQNDLDSGMRTEHVLAKWTVDSEGDLVNGDLWMPKFKRQELESAIAMEKLGTSHKQSTARLQKPEPAKDGDIPERPPYEPPGGVPVIPAPMPAGLSRRPAGGAAAMPSGAHGPGHSSPRMPAPPHASGRPGGTAAATPAPEIGTGLDGYTGPAGGAGGAGGGGTGDGGTGVARLPSRTGGSHGTAAGPPTLPAIPAAVPGAIPGGPPSGGVKASGAAGSGAAGSGSAGSGGAGAPAGRAGTGAARTGTGAARTGTGTGPARQRGGTAGAPGDTGVGGVAQGGSGLHRSRGGTQAAASGKDRGTRGPGLVGTPGGRGATRNEGQRRGGPRRPDYLLEDEETWTPRRRVAPRVIE
ncbi:hypothetical protein ACWD6P_08735 [Streptomyces sp. NPDC002446]